MAVLQSSVNWVLTQAHLRLGNYYVYGGVYSPTDLSRGADCSGVVGWVLEALTKTPARMSWLHVVSTESWYYDYPDSRAATPGTVGPYGTVAISAPQDAPADAALLICISHGGGGEDSHMDCVVPLPGTLPYQGTIVESNGSYGSCTNGTGAYDPTDPLWTDWWYLPGPWTMDVPPGTYTEPPAPVAKSVYTVQPGDCLDVIAAVHGVTLSDLESANPQITDFDYIYPGQEINIP
jgi:LysM repeat protein